LFKFLPISHCNCDYPFCVCYIFVPTVHYVSWHVNLLIPCPFHSTIALYTHHDYASTYFSSYLTVKYHSSHADFLPMSLHIFLPEDLPEKKIKTPTTAVRFERHRSHLPPLHNRCRRLSCLYPCNGNIQRQQLHSCCNITLLTRIDVSCPIHHAETGRRTRFLARTMQPLMHPA
jgi:hypothetical protein